MTAEKFLELSDNFIRLSEGTKNRVLNVMISFAKLKVEEAIAEIARAEANSIEEANNDKEYMLTMYPLNNIK